MSRTVSLKSLGEFAVSDDPEQVIATALNMIAVNLDIRQIEERLGPNGSGFHIDTLGSVYRIEGRDELPEPWEQDTTLDPEVHELWALYRDPRRGEIRHRRAYVLGGEELRSLAAQAKALLDARDADAKALDARNRPGD